MWEFAYVCYCFAIIRPLLKIMSFTSSELEQALLHPETNNGLMADIHVRIIKGPVIDTKARSYLEET